MCDLFKVIVSPWRGQYWFLKKVPLYRAWNAQCVMWSQFRKNGLSLPSLTHSFVCSSYCALSVELDARNTPVSSTGLILRRNLIIVRGWCWHEGNDGRLGNREAKEASLQGEKWSRYNYEAGMNFLNLVPYLGLVYHSVWEFMRTYLFYDRVLFLN